MAVENFFAMKEHCTKFPSIYNCFVDWWLIMSNVNEVSLKVSCLPYWLLMLCA